MVIHRVILDERMNIRSKKKISVVFSGGGIKAAAFHIGVCLALKEKGFQFAGGSKELVKQAYPEGTPLTIRSYVGSSAGSFVAAILSAGYPVESLINAFQLGLGASPRYSKDDLAYLKPLGYRHIFYLNGARLLKFLPETLLRKSLVSGGFEALLKTGFKLNGLFTTKGVERYLRKEALVENDFSRLGVDLFIIATQLNHSRKAIFGHFPESFKTPTTKFINYASISEAVACSSALPPVFAPFPVKKSQDKEIYFYDGEIRDTLSTHVAADHGADLVIASYSMQPYHYVEEVGSLHKFGVPVIINQALYQVLEQKVTQHIKHQNNYKAIYEDVNTYLKGIKLDSDQRKKVLNIICERAKFKPEVDYIYIHPKPQNYEMFFTDHFSLNPQILERIVRIGFKSALNALRGYQV